MTEIQGEIGLVVVLLIFIAAAVVECVRCLNRIEELLKAHGTSERPH